MEPRDPDISKTFLPSFLLLLSFWVKTKMDEIEKSGADLSLSIEETNKLRIKLGLKPLKVDENAEKQKKDKEAEIEKEKEEKEKERKTAELALKISK